MSGITPRYLTVKDLLQARSFAIDDYQREYRWDNKNIAELVSDLQVKFLTSYHDGDTPKSSSLYAEYFLGSIIEGYSGGLYFVTKYPASARLRERRPAS